MQKDKNELIIEILKEQILTQSRTIEDKNAILNSKTFQTYMLMRKALNPLTNTMKLLKRKNNGRTSHYQLWIDNIESKWISSLGRSGGKMVGVGDDGRAEVTAGGRTEVTAGGRAKVTAGDSAEVTASSSEYLPKISIIMPISSVELPFLQKAIASVQEQSYANWELCICFSSSMDREIINFIENLKDIRIKVISENLIKSTISLLYNQSIRIASGEYILFMEGADILPSFSLNEIAKVAKSSGADVIYYDEDIISLTDKRISPIFKPDFAPETLLSQMYMSHSTYRRMIVNKIGGMKEGTEVSLELDLILRVSEITKNITHIPHILYHWRAVKSKDVDLYFTEKRFFLASSKRFLESALQRRGIPGTITKGLTEGSFKINYKLLSKPIVSIIIPTKDKKDVLEKCVKSILEKTNYKNIEIIIVDHDSEEQATKDYLLRLQRSKKIKVLKYSGEFNYSKINNYAATQAKGEFLIFLNNDTEVITPNWIEEMLEFAMRPEIGAVGALLVYPSQKIQHCGVVLDIGIVAGHIYRGKSVNHPSGLNETRLQRNVSALTAACLMVERKKFFEVGGFEEKMKVVFNDVEFCIKLMSLGYRNIYTPYAKIMHYESITRGEEDTPEKVMRAVDEILFIRNKWGIEYFKKDKYYNANLTRKDESGDLPITYPLELHGHY